MARRGAGASEVEWEIGSFLGVHDSPDPAGSRVRRLIDAVNCFVPDLVNGSAVKARHGMLGLHTALAGRGQGLFLHRRLDGQLDRYVFAGGRLYRWDGADTCTDVTPTGIAIDRESPVYCATFNDAVIVSDGNNKPWVFDPNAGTGTVIEYNAALDEWSAQGPPVIYSGVPIVIVKAVGASNLAAENGDTLIAETGVAPNLLTELLSGFRNTLAWGSPLDPFTGYDQTDTDYNWQLTQSSSEILAALFAEEGTVVYWRNKGIGTVVGTPDETFRANATRDAISNTSGTDAPAAVLAVNRKVYYLDLDGRVHRLVLGAGEPQQLWYPTRREIDEHLGLDANRAYVAQNARAGYHEAYGLVLFTIWDRQTVYAFDAESGTFVGTWRVGDGIHIDAMGTLVDADDRATFCILGTRDDDGDGEQGVLWRQKHDDDAMQWLDQADASVASYLALERAAETHWLASKAAKSFRLLHVAAEFSASATRHEVGLQYVVPSSGLSARLVAETSATTGEFSDTDSVSVARWSVGKNAQGSAARLRFTCTHSDNVQWGLHDVTVRAQVTQARTGTR